MLFAETEHEFENETSVLKFCQHLLINCKNLFLLISDTPVRLHIVATFAKSHLRVKNTTSTTTCGIQVELIRSYLFTGPNDASSVSKSETGIGFQHHLVQ